MRWCWKIIDAEPLQSSPPYYIPYVFKTLYHGNHGSRTLLRNTWIKADRKLVNDKGKPYISGWHVFLDRDDAHKYLKRFKKTYFITLVLVKRVWKKPHSRSNVYLTRWIKLP